MTILGPWPGVYCPGCQSAVLAATNVQWSCRNCERRFPVLYVIPDLRLAGDRYLDLDEERDKARRLADRANDLTFEQILSYYYRITDDVKPSLAARYKAGAVTAPARFEPLIAELARSLPARARVLDAGCATGGALIAGTKLGLNMLGVDIALRWLVICRKRLQEMGFDIPLICADVTRMRIAGEGVNGVLALDLLDHLDDARKSFAALKGVMTADAILVTTTGNRFSPGPELATGLWAIGFLPRSMRRRFVRRVLGVDALRNTSLRSNGEIRRAARDAGFRLLKCSARRWVGAASAANASEDLLRTLYTGLASHRVSGALMAGLSPSAEMWFAA